MAANRFATMLHRNTNKITVILIYAVLEWILIVLLLLNSLFSYMIIKFAEFFGLKPPCLWCTRIDHIFGAAKGHRDLLCEAHCREISKLGFCSNHRKLVESQDLCEDCLLEGSSKNLAWMKGFGVMQKGEETVGENGGVSLNNCCCCCGVCLDDAKYSSYILLKTSSWDVLECAQKENLISDFDVHDSSDEKVLDSSADVEVEIVRNSEVDCVLEKENLITDFDGSDEKVLDSSADVEVEIVRNLEVDCVSAKSLGAGEDETHVEKEKEKERENLMMKDKAVQVCVEEDEIPPQQHLEFFLDYSGNTLVPIELIDSNDNGIEGDDDQNKDQEREAVLVLERESRVGEKVDTFLDVDINEEPSYSMLDVMMEMEEDENSLVFHAKDSHSLSHHFEAFPLARWPSMEANEDREIDEAFERSDDRADNVACEEVCEEVAQASNENEADVSIGTEIPDLDIADEMQIQDSVHLYECTRVEDDHGPMNVEEQMMELQSLSFEDMKNNHSSLQSEINEIEEEEEDKFPDTPTSVDSLNHLHKKLLLLEKRDSGAEESLDGSVTSELEGGDGVVTVERLKAALRSERKALQALYAELEEERSASAVAANQTMAMINRLQEEKAAMQMEALQYQRMMEEQSEYDQEALQLLNELMVKREREKQELERELEGYRSKMRVLRRSKDGSTRSGFSSASCSNGDDSDGLSLDLNQEAKEEDGFYSYQEYDNQNTPVDAVVNLEQSLADFEEERMSILEQLKVLEEKLLTLDYNDEKEHHFEDVEAMADLHEENGDDHADENGHHQHHHLNGEANGHTNGFAKEMMNGKKHHHLRRTAGQKGKSLLPLFDAICDENGEDAMMNGNGVHDSYESKSEETENKKLAIEEEVDHLYERLQALEADREFLKHCITSLKKGDKGMDLLQEILQHLRDLRNVELRVRNLGDSAII